MGRISRITVRDDKKMGSLKKKVSRDKNDDHILALAVQEQVDAIITGDKDLLVLKKYKKIPILQPKDSWKFLLSNSVIQE